jgi:hypothetical protein
MGLLSGSSQLTTGRLPAEEALLHSIPYDALPRATGRNPRQRFWLVSALFEPAAFAQAALSLILLASIAFAMGSAGPRPLEASLTRKIKVEEEVGRLVHHTPRAVFLDGDYGLSLEYHGQISGESWPLTTDFAWEKLAGFGPRRCSSASRTSRERGRSTTSSSSIEASINSSLNSGDSSHGFRSTHSRTTT